jgi:predicted Fe-Mo cluster-binding NifX family protein
MFVLVDTDSMEFEAVTNPAINAPSGAGIEAAQFVADSGATAVITGRVGPKAMGVLQSAGIPVHLSKGGTVREVVETFKAGELSAASGANAPSKSGLTDSPSRSQGRSGELARRKTSGGLRIAFSSEENRGLDSAVSHHFGRCPYYVLVDVEEGKPGTVMAVENPFYGDHQPGQVPRFIRSQEADVIIAGGMGRRAVAIFESENIEPITGAQGTVAEAMEAYLAGRLDGAAPCHESVAHAHEHHHHGHHGDDRRRS